VKDMIVGTLLQHFKYGQLLGEVWYCMQSNGFWLFLSSFRLPIFAKVAKRRGLTDLVL
jgi:hypothetical protein